MTIGTSPTTSLEAQLETIEESWTRLAEDDDGHVFRIPADPEEVARSREALEAVRDAAEDDPELLERIETLEAILDESLFGDDAEAMRLLQEVYESWSDKHEEDGAEYAQPGRRSEVRRSKALLARVRALDVQSPWVLEQLEETEEVLETADRTLPRFGGRFGVSLAISVVAVAGLVLAFQTNTYEAPEFDYDPAQFVTRRPTSLSWMRSTNVDYVDTYDLKLPKGTQLVPLARKGSDWIWAQTEDGQRGFVHYEALSGMRHVVTRRDAALFEKASDIDIKAKGEPAGEALEGEIVGRSKVQWGMKKGSRLTVLKVALADGRTRWLREYDVRYPFKDGLPKLNLTYTLPILAESIESRIVGKTLAEVEARYEPASSHLKTRRTNVAWFDHIEPVVDGEHFWGLKLFLDDADRIVRYEPTGHGSTRLYDRLPLARELLRLDAVRVFGANYYKTGGWNPDWLQSFRDLHWSTNALGWLLKAGRALALILLFFSIPRLLAGPVMIPVAYWNVLPNGLVKTVNVAVLVALAYVFFLVMALSMDQMFTPLLIGAPVAYFWVRRHLHTVAYHRCPRCHRMYSAIDRGTTHLNRTRQVSRGHYDVYAGKTETETQIIHHYQRRSMQSVKLIDHYADHRSCAHCGYRWDVDRDQTAKSWTEYH